MKLKIPLLVFTATFILVHGFLTGWLPIPLVVDLDVIARENQPVAYTYTNDSFDQCIYEVSIIHGLFGNIIAIEYWYHWSYDGFEERDDWEPVIVYVKDGATAVAHRVHYQWRIKTTGIILEGNRPVIVFAPLWHTPLNTYPTEGYVKASYVCVKGVPPEDIDPSQIYYGEPSPQLWLKNTILSLAIAGIASTLTYIALSIHRVVM